MSEEEEFIQEAKPQEEVNLVKLLKSIIVVSFRPKSEVSVYDGNFNVEELIDWLNTLDTYFDYEDFHEEKKVKFVVTKLRVHEYIWWDGVQDKKKYESREKCWLS